MNWPFSRHQIVATCSTLLPYYSQYFSLHLAYSTFISHIYALGFQHSLLTFPSSLALRSKATVMVLLTPFMLCATVLSFAFSGSLVSFLTIKVSPTLLERLEELNTLDIPIGTFKVIMIIHSSQGCLGWVESLGLLNVFAACDPFMRKHQLIILGQFLAKCYSIYDPQFNFESWS